ncbi:MAG TPA: hypothetical protein VIQ05_21945 [Tardiphaga sp.]
MTLMVDRLSAGAACYRAALMAAKSRMFGNEVAAMGAAGSPWTVTVLNRFPGLRRLIIYRAFVS